MGLLFCKEWVFRGANDRKSDGRLHQYSGGLALYWVVVPPYVSECQKAFLFGKAIIEAGIIYYNEPAWNGDKYGACYE